jgi:hypothetical protein
MTHKTLPDHFSALENQGQAWKVIYPLNEILLLILCAVMSGADDFVEIERWGRRKLDFLRSLFAPAAALGNLYLVRRRLIA